MLHTAPSQPPRFRSEGGLPDDLIPVIRAEVQALHPDVPFPRIETASALVERRMFSWRVAASLFRVLGLLALALQAAQLDARIARGAVVPRGCFR